MAGTCTLGSFSLQDVVDKVNPSTDDLVTCIAESDVNLWDPEYEGGKNNLANFRNYGCGILNLTAGNASCSTTTLLYSVISSNQNTVPGIGDSFEVDMGSGTTNTFVGNALKYNYIYNGTFYPIRISNSGLITELFTPC
tara:strand:+ start:66 stop:482 length:417 start_codon:yes stop_codon:yes gene_type:complete